MKKILIVGGSGFIGKSIIAYFSEHYNQYFCIDYPDSSILDCTDEELVDDWFINRYYDEVILLANYSSYRHSNREGSLFVEKNIRIFWNFYKHKDKYGRLFYTGSGAEYDKRYNIVEVSEDFAGKTIPADEYGLVKYTIGQLIENSENCYNLRIFGLFGKLEYYPAKFISGLCAKAVVGLPLTIRQDLLFDFLWIDDFCRIVFELLNKESLNYHTYNVASGKKINLLEIAQIVNVISEKNLPIIVCNEGIGKEYTASNERLLSELGGAFEFTTMEEAVSDIYSYFLNSSKRINLEELIYG